MYTTNEMFGSKGAPLVMIGCTSLTLRRVKALFMLENGKVAVSRLRDIVVSDSVRVGNFGSPENATVRWCLLRYLSSYLHRRAGQSWLISAVWSPRHPMQPLAVRISMGDRIELVDILVYEKNKRSGKQTGESSCPSGGSGT